MRRRRREIWVGFNVFWILEHRTRGDQKSEISLELSIDSRGDNVGM